MIKNKLPLLKTSALSLVAGSLLVTSASAQTALLHYTFDGASGDASDFGAAPAANGSLEGTAARAAGGPSPIGAAGSSVHSLDFTGGDAYVDAGNGAKFDGLSQFTVTGWINLQGDPTGNLRFVSKQAASTYDGFSFQLKDPSSGTRSASNFGLTMFVGGENGFQYDLGSPGGTFDADNKWLFLAVTYDGTSSADNVSYYSGNEIAPVLLSHSTTINAGALNDSTARVMIGRTDAAPTASVNPDAFIDDVRIYSGVLDATQLDDVRLAIPEPSTYATIFGGLALVGAFVYRRRLNAKK